MGSPCWTYYFIYNFKYSSVHVSPKFPVYLVLHPYSWFWMKILEKKIPESKTWKFHIPGNFLNNIQFTLCMLQVV